METIILREKLTEYIKVADEKKLEAIYTLLENDIESDYKWYEDGAFVAELEEEHNKIISGEIKSYSVDEIKEDLKQQKLELQLSYVPG